MHLLAEQTVAIECPVSKAYDFATNMEHFGDWFPGVLSIRSANEQAHAEVGKAYLETVQVPVSGKRDIRLLVKEARANAFFATEGHFKPLLPRMEMVFEPTGAESCRVTWRMFSRNRSLLARVTVVPLARRVLARRSVQGVAALRRKLEG